MPVLVTGRCAASVTGVPWRFLHALDNDAPGRLVDLHRLTPGWIGGRRPDLPLADQHHATGPADGKTLAFDVGRGSTRPHLNFHSTPAFGTDHAHRRVKGEQMGSDETILHRGTCAGRSSAPLCNGYTCGFRGGVARRDGLAIGAWEPRSPLAGSGRPLRRGSARKPFPCLS